MAKTSPDQSLTFIVGRVLRQSTDGQDMRYKLQLYSSDDRGAWSEVSGRGSKKTVTMASILLVGIQLTRRTSKIRKADLTKIKAILDTATQ